MSQQRTSLLVGCAYERVPLLPLGLQVLRLGRLALSGRRKLSFTMSLPALMMYIPDPTFPPFFWSRLCTHYILPCLDNLACRQNYWYPVKTEVRVCQCSIRRCLEHFLFTPRSSAMFSQKRRWLTAWVLLLNTPSQVRGMRFPSCLKAARPILVMKRCTGMMSKTIKRV